MGDAAFSSPDLEPDLLLTAPGEPDFDRGEPDFDLGEPDFDLGDPDLDLLRAFFTGERESDLGEPDLDRLLALTGDREPDLDLLPDFDLADPAAEPDRLPDLDLTDPAAEREAADPDLLLAGDPGAFSGE